jgi:4-diphosphocytidyl-2-C-methyl-D-erythritol kinase
MIVSANRTAQVVAAPAKLNLFLELTGKRPDGFHELESLMLTVDLFDTLELTPNGLETVRITSNDPTLPTGETNLVTKAIRRLRPAGGVDIVLTKRIPHEAGMGGGSSDAAATLGAIDAMFALTADVASHAAALGSDVNVFLTPPAGWCTGRGEIVEPAPVGGTFHFVVVKPPVGCPTGEVYKRVTVPSVKRSGQDARDGLATGDAEKLAAGLFNRLEGAAFAVAPAVRAVRDLLLAARPLAAQVTGSGSAVFALCRSREDAIRVAGEYPRTDETVYVLRGLERDR